MLVALDHADSVAQLLPRRDVEGVRPADLVGDGLGGEGVAAVQADVVEAEDAVADGEGAVVLGDEAEKLGWVEAVEGWRGGGRR